MPTTVAVSEETKRLLSTLKAKENSPTYEDLIIKLVKKAYSEKGYGNITSFLFEGGR